MFLFIPLRKVDFLSVEISSLEGKGAYRALHETHPIGDSKNNPSCFTAVSSAFDSVLLETAYLYHYFRSISY